MTPLTRRERQAMDLLVEDADRSNDEIGVLMGVSGSQVRHLLSRAFRKYGVEGRTKAAIVHVRPVPKPRRRAVPDGQMEALS